MSWTHFLNDSLRLLVFPAVALVISGVLTWCCIRIFPRIGLVDIPRGRHSHKAATPVGGGIAIAISFFVVCGTYALERSWFCQDHDLLNQLRNFSFPAALILITGLLDDRYELSSWVKLAAQIGAGVLIYFLNGGIYILFGWHFPIYVGLPLTVIWVVAIINAFNLIDGLDGLAAGLASISSATIAMWLLFHERMPESAAMMLIFSGACLGFLRFNFSPARIFMGDTGSMFIGLLFAFINSNQITKSVTVSSLLLPLLAIGVPVFDVFLAVWRRSLRKLSNPGGSGIMTGDSDHLHHRILRRTKSQSRTALLLYLIAVGFSAVGVLLAMMRNILPGVIFLIVLAGVFWVIKLADIEVRDSFNYIISGVARPSCRLLLVAMHPIIDLGIFSASFFLVYMLFLRWHPGFPLVRCYTLFVVPFMLILYLSGIYRTYWLRAGLNRYYMLLKIILFSGALVFGLICLLQSRKLLCSADIVVAGLPPLDLISIYLFYFAVAAGLIGCERFIMRYLEGFGLYNFMMLTGRDEQDETPLRVLVVGGGRACRLFIAGIHCHLQKEKLDIVGIIDDNRSLKNLNIYGFDVLGGTADLEDIYARIPFDRLVITLRSAPEERGRCMAEFCRRHNVEMSVFKAEDRVWQPEQLVEQIELLPAPATPLSGK